jgi:UDP-N-acetylglucosamine:LPS N-acetylglucosamine transferase
VVLSAWESEIESAISFLVQFPENIELHLKFHPSTDIKKYKNHLPVNIKIVDEDLYECFKTAKLVIGRSTGALVEAISLGIPAIVLDSNGLCHDFIPSQADGRGLIWDKASNISEALELIKRFEENLITKSDKIESLTKKYKEMFFCEPSDQKIIEAFDLS